MKVFRLRVPKRANLPKRFISDVVKKSTSVENSENELMYKRLKLTETEIQEHAKIGFDITLNQAIRQEVSNAGFYFKDSNEALSLQGHTGYKLTYLRNMQLLYEFDLVFRDYLQCIARFDYAGLRLFSESRLRDYLVKNLMAIQKGGYILEIDSLKIKQQYELLDLVFYKNLHVDRYLNLNKDIQMSRFGPLHVAKHSADSSIFDNPRPFILAATMKVTTPMKIALYNQNHSRKIYGGETKERIDYVVRFEAEMDLSDLLWVLPTQNKPGRTRQIRITDFNNVLRGNPFFTDRFDLIGKNRSHYMGNDIQADGRVVSLLEQLNSQHLGGINSV